MTLLFDRKYNLTIGAPTTILNPPSSIALKGGYSDTGWQSGKDWRTSNTNNAALITDLQIEANINSTSNNSSSSGGSGTVIKVYNMSATTRNIVEKVNNYIILEAGYVQDPELKMVFSGQVKTAFTERQGQNMVTTFICEEGYTPNNSIKFSHKFSESDTYGDVLHYLARAYADNGIPTGEIIDSWGDDITTSRQNTTSSSAIVGDATPQTYTQLPVMLARPANQKLINGFSAVGFLHQVLENVCSQLGYVSYITNGRLFIHPKGFTRTIEEFQFNSSQMKSIRKLNAQTTNTSVGTGIDGIKIVTFLDGRLDIDKRIKIEDGEFQGTYKIITKSHNMDYENGAWDTVITCKNAS